MKRRMLFAAIVLFQLFSCSSGDENPNNVVVENFINEVLDIMESNSINRNDINWIEFREQVLDRASNAQNIDQTIWALQLALQLLGDNHSFIRRQNGVVISASSLSCQPNDFPEVKTPADVGYIKISSFSGSTDNAGTIAFAEEIQDQIRNADSQEIKGWIVDLRGNIGGNMWPMLAGIGPILGEGVVGYFIDPDGSAQSWSYSSGASILDQRSLVQVSNTYELLNPNPRVAVLLDQAVISSGEAIAIAFVGRENTQSFGSSTCGLSTANLGFSLTDGSTLFLTTAFMADRERNIFGVPIEPDVSTSDDEIIQLAIDYIQN